MKITELILMSFLCLPFAALGQPETNSITTSRNRLINSTLTAIVVKLNNNQTENLGSLELKAIAVIRKDHPQFSTDNFGFGCFIDPASSTNYLTFTYSNGFGQPLYRVYFKGDGTVAGYFKGTEGG